ncbi:type I polyketide synthase [Nocardia sp. NPDC056952]|uniref:type I polyketide synthase n=1 Tax=Nocardia sp. NPDC056952 TaxID=3345979 RepID=UPI00363ED010
MGNEDKLRQYLKRVTADLRATRKRLQEVESGSDEPVAIVSMSCRLPGGADSPEALWELVSSGVDAIGEPPVHRGWGRDGAGGERAAAPIMGGFVYDAADFDAELFGISPREALAMDPQQRLLLEASWEVLERAGIDPLSVRGSRTGVFVGGTSHDHAVKAAFGGADTEGYLLTGSAGSVLSGRVSYTLGLEGPAITIDTACSSSLVALHLAARALNSGECSLAIAGGVAVMSTPSVFAEFSTQDALSSSGRCKSFAAAADGTAWGEGVSLVLVERLSDARRNGHPVLAILRGSAVNQDGASNGLTAPNGPSQQRVIREALDNTRLSAADVDVVEAHGTGTVLGDPIEAQALLATYGPGRPEDRPLLLGSIKSNIGHTMAAAGVAGVIKMVEALRRGQVPATLHVDEPTPKVDWSSGGVELVTELRPWPTVDRPRRAAVSSFGASGTNVHLVLEQSPVLEEVPIERAGEPPVVLPIVVSARSRQALAAQAGRLSALLADRPDVDLADVAGSLMSTRALLPHRAVVVAGSTTNPQAGLLAVANGESAPNVIGGVARPGRVVFVFPGQGAQWVGMGRELLSSSEVFAARMAECAAVMDPLTGWSLLDVVVGDGDSLDRVDVVQPVSFAVMVSLAAVWESFGVVPDVVVGHSQGEIAAACVSGALSLVDAVRVVVGRSRVIASALSGRGGMVSVALSVGRVEELIAGWGDRVSVAAMNGPESSVVSGEVAVLEEVVAECERRGVRVRRVDVDYASHSVQVDSVAVELAGVLAGVVPRVGRVPLFSTVRGELLDGSELDGGYWFENLRRPVGFAGAVESLLGGNYRFFVEVSSHPVLVPAIQEAIEAADLPAIALGTLRRDSGGFDRMTTALATAFAHGAAVDWSPFYAGAGRVELPTYAFARQRYWLEQTAAVKPSSEPAFDAEFWEVVERGDVTALASGLGVDTEAATAILPGLATWRRHRHDCATVDSWRYAVDWQSIQVTGGASRSWLVLVPADLVGDADVLAVARTLGDAQVREICTEDRTELATVLAEFSGIDGVVSFGNTTTTTLALVQALGDAGVGAPLWLVTRGAVAVAAPDPRQSELWGLGPVVGLEHAQRWGGLVDLPTTLDDRALEEFVAVLSGSHGEDQVAIRENGVLARRIVPARANSDVAAPTWQTSGTALITGGTGSIGAITARWVIERGAQRVVLASRRGVAAAGTDELAAELRSLGAEVEIVACDIADRDAVAALVALAHADEAPLRTVIHAAASLEIATLPGTTVDEFEAMMRAKVQGAIHLNELTEGIDLDAFVLFSSIAGVWGSGAHGAYGAANAHLHALAQQQRARGRVALCIAWGVWGTPNMWDSSNLVEGMVFGERQTRHGMPPMDPDRALAGMHIALDRDETFLLIADIDWANFFPLFTVARRSPLLTTVPDVARILVEQEPTRTSAGADSILRERLSSMTERDRIGFVLEQVRTEVAIVLGHAGADAVDPDRAFQELGFNSLTAVELRNRLVESTGMKLPSTMVFDYPTTRDLALYLIAEAFGIDPVQMPESAAPSIPVDDDPVVIVAMACRYPGGVASPAELWQLAMDGVDAISGFPTDRGWGVDTEYHADPEHPGASYLRQGGFLYDAADFDADLFGISPREALAMDPQQRILLESSWELFERAGIDPLSMHGSRTGVFVGGTSQDHSIKAVFAGADTEGYIVTGSAASALSGRVSYELGLEGPAITVDTACSSSLVALHLAVESVRRDECTMAIAGGVTVMSTPSAFGEFKRQGGLASSGRCKAFSASADGIGFGEGVGLVLFERLSHARRNGHQVLAVVRGSAVNQDGASNGFSAPNGPSQQRVIRQALASSRLTAADVDVVEAHGTGTTLGDPIEAQALLATYGRERSADQPLWLGSIKSNIGHTMAAAGVAGVIKMVEAMRRGAIPPTLHVDSPTPQVDWSSGTMELLTDSRPWPELDRARRAGVSSFGISGTNAHMILEQAQNEPSAPQSQVRPVDHAFAWALSARSAAGLRAQAQQLQAYVEADPSAEPADIASALVHSRAALGSRALVVAADRSEFISGLAALSVGDPAVGVESGDTIEGRTVFVFPGQGAQWVGMGRELLSSSEVFAARMAECAAVMDPLTGWSLLDVVVGDGDSLDRVDVVQPVSFAVMVSLAAVWESFGVVPDVVVGHSQGEIAAACVSGALSLVDAVRVVVGRSRVIASALSGRGGMVSVALSVGRVEELIAGWGDRVSVAAMNGPESSVVSGEVAVLEEVVAECERRGVRVRRVDVDYASHSVQVDSVAVELAGVLAGVVPRVGRVPLFSTVRGELLDGSELDGGYWFENLRRPVGFAGAVESLLGGNYRFFVEVSSHPVLVPAIEQVADAGDRTAAVIGTLRRGDGGQRRLLQSLGQAWVHGLNVDRCAVFGSDSPRQRVELPTYAFQRQRYWLEFSAAGDTESTPQQPDSPESEFWRLVESGDLESLADLVGVDPASGPSGVVAALPQWRNRAHTMAIGDAWRHIDAWRPFEITTGSLEGRWLLVLPSEHDRLPLVATILEAFRPADCALVAVSSDDDQLSLAEKIRGVLGFDRSVHGVLSLLALTRAFDPSHPDVSASVSANLYLTQALADLDLDARQWWLTYGAVVAGGDDPVPTAAHAQLWGLGRVVALEQPRTWGGVIDLPATVDANVVASVAGVVSGDHGEDQVSVRGEQVFGRRLVPSAPDRRRWAPRGTVLITGGTGALGGHVARWAATHGAGHILLVSRTGGEAQTASELTTELRDLGAEVTFAACDVSDPAALAAVFDQIPAEHPLRAVVHTAGVVSSGRLAETTVEQIAVSNAAKVAGARNLDRLTRDCELDAFVLFSSGAASWGSAGSAAYALGNAYLDGLALERRACGLPATSIAWGLWGGGGMAEGAAEMMLGRRGLRHMMPEAAVYALAAAVVGDDTLVTVADVDWAWFAQTFTIARPSRLIAEIPAVRESLLAQQEVAGPSASDWTAGLARLSVSEQLEQLTAAVRTTVATVLGHQNSDAVDPGRLFLELGFDSLTAIDLRNRLSQILGLDLRSSLAFDYPTVTSLAEQLQTMLTDGEQPSSVDSSMLSITSLYRDACGAHRYVEANEMAMAAALLRPTFTTAIEMSMTREPLKLASGTQEPVLIGIPATSPLSGPYEFSRIAKHFQDQREFWVLPLSGFHPGERLPATWEVLVDTVVDAVLHVADGRPFVLVGRSAGGTIAHGVEVGLEKRGARAEGVVLLDTFEIGSKETLLVQPGVLRHLYDQENKVGKMDDIRLTAMSGYYRLLANWERREITCPTLFVAAADADADTGVSAVWSLEHELATVPGDHFSMTEEYSIDTATAIENWIRSEGM